MTTLETRIYSHPSIPLADISPLEMLILTNVLECSETEEGLVLFTDVRPTNPIRVPRGELVAAFDASAKNAGDPINVFIADRVLALLPAGGNVVEGDVMVDIDLSHFPWQFVVQGIVARSPDLREVSVIQWMNHPSQRPESFSPACRTSGMPSDGKRCGPMSARSCPSLSPSMTTSAKSLRQRVSPSISILRRHLSRPCAGPRTGRPAKANRKSSVIT